MLTWIAEEKTCPPKHSAIAKMYLIRVRVRVLGLELGLGC